MISDQVEDYLNVYANAQSVVTDRIHTAISSICYETEVALYTNSDRVEMFRRVGCRLDKDSLDPVRVNWEQLDIQKKFHLVVIKGVIENEIR
jgi:hypothetical protein